MAADKIREGSSFLLADRWYDDKQVSDKVVEKGYKPLVRPRGYGARGKASKLRDKLWRDFRAGKTLQAKRSWRRLLWL